ncbi:MAG: hypothetical protein HYR60_07780 [Acidobacteria bacterium]|nr:hypothetical protein [Acidobacteriota bacterium]
MKTRSKVKKAAKGRLARKRPTVGERIIEGLEQAVAWTRGENDRIRVTIVHVSAVDVRDVRQGIR